MLERGNRQTDKPEAPMVPSHDIDRIDNIGLGFRIRIYDLYELWLSMTKHNILNTYRYIYKAIAADGSIPKARI